MLLIALAVVLIAAALAWAAAALLHAPLLLTGLIVLAGLAAAGVILFLHFRVNKQDAAVDGTGANAELDLLLNDANRKLKSSQQGGKSIESLPLIYVLGDAGSAKSTLVLRSGLEPELLAGTAPRDSDVVPTALLNLWYTHQGVILEVGDGVRHSGSALSRLVVRTRPQAYRSAFGSGAPARAAVVCVSAEKLLGGDSAGLVVAARATGEQVREISRLLGAALPVYVIVTKLDRVPHFAEYVRNLSAEEVRQVFGVTLRPSDSSAGVYAERATRELGEALDSLYYSLGEFRVEALGREAELRSAAAAYEFPREFGKLRRNIAQYLVELCKPSQLSANPYLRGFYFTGVRAQMVEQVASQPTRPPEGAERNYSSTSIFQAEDLELIQRAAAQPVRRSVRVPQWTFLPRLFPEMIFGDRSALTATRQTAPARLFRRALFATIAVAFALYSVFLLVSYVNNSEMESAIAEAAKALPVGGTAVGDAELKSLDSLRRTIVKLDRFERNGAPWTYHFGLYQGDKLDERARKIYFDRFKPMFLEPTQQAFSKYLAGLDNPIDTNDTLAYNAAYNPLKSYLITTKRPDKSDPVFLTPVFMRYWPGANTLNDEQKKLAQTQVDFYASELLRTPPPYSSVDSEGSAAVRQGRAYLSQFKAAQRIYQDLLNAADKGNDEIDFNKKYDPQVLTINEPHRVRGAFTKGGFEFIQRAAQAPGAVSDGDWVLGSRPAQESGGGDIGSQLKGMYWEEYIKIWLDFLRDAKFVGCGGGLTPTSGLLSRLVAPASPLLELVYTVSYNTDVSDPKIKAVFRPANALVSSQATDKFIGVGSNQEYMTALGQVAAQVSALAHTPPNGGDTAAFSQLQQAISAANAAAGNTQMNQFHVIDSYATERLVTDLMNKPITCAQDLIPPPDAALKEAGAKICKALGPLMSEYPFNPKSSKDASIDDVNRILSPETGAVWAIYNASLTSLVTKNGTQFSPNPVSTPPVNPAFLSFLNQLGKISNGLYPAGAQTPSFKFTVKVVPTAGISNATLILDNQRIPPGSDTPVEFAWNGLTAHTASFASNSTEPAPTQGTWSLFRIIDDPLNTWPPGGDLEVPISTMIGSHQGLSGNRMKFEISGPGAAILRSGALTLRSCPAPVGK